MTRPTHDASRVVVPLVMALSLCAGAPPARAGPATRPAATLSDLGRALTACFQSPVPSVGDSVTVLLSLTRAGDVLGQPRITASHLVGDEAVRRAFVAAALGSLKACTPVAITPGLGGAIAGRPFAIRFRGGPPAQPI